MNKSLTLSGFFICISAVSPLCYAAGSLFPSAPGSPGYQANFSQTSTAHYGRDQNFMPGDQGYVSPAATDHSYSHIPNDFHVYNQQRTSPDSTSTSGFVMAAEHHAGKKTIPNPVHVQSIVKNRFLTPSQPENTNLAKARVTKRASKAIHQSADPVVVRKKKNSIPQQPMSDTGSASLSQSAAFGDQSDAPWSAGSPAFSSNSSDVVQSRLIEQARVQLPQISPQLLSSNVQPVSACSSRQVLDKKPTEQNNNSFSLASTNAFTFTALGRSIANSAWSKELAQSLRSHVSDEASTHIAHSAPAPELDWSEGSSLQDINSMETSSSLFTNMLPAASVRSFDDTSIDKENPVSPSNFDRSSLSAHTGNTKKDSSITATALPKLAQDALSEALDFRSVPTKLDANITISKGQYNDSSIRSYTGSNMRYAAIDAKKADVAASVSEAARLVDYTQRSVSSSSPRQGQQTSFNVHANSTWYPQTAQLPPKVKITAQPVADSASDQGGGQNAVDTPNPVDPPRHGLVNPGTDVPRALKAYLNLLGSLSLNKKLDNYPVSGIGVLSQNADFTYGSTLGVMFGMKHESGVSIQSRLELQGVHQKDGNDYKLKLPALNATYQMGAADFRLGRFLYPGLLYSEVKPLAGQYPFVFLPSEVYSLVPFDSINGVEYGRKQSLAHNWNYRYDAFFGLSKSDYDLGGVQNTILKTGYSRTAGLAVTVSDPAIRLNGSITQVSLKGNRTYAGDKVESFDSLNTWFYSLGLAARIKAFGISSEFVQRNMPSNYANQRGYYASFFYKWGNFEPSLTLGQFDTLRDPAVKYGVSQKQKSYTVATKFVITPAIQSKVGFSHIIPEQGSDGLGLNGSKAVNVVGLSVSGVI